MGMYPGGNIVRVTPTVEAGTTTTDHVMFGTTEIPNAVSSRGGVSLLHSVGIIDYDNEKHDMDIVFMRNNVSIGAHDGVPSWSDSDIVSAEIIGGIDVDWSVARQGLVAADLAFFSGTNRNANTQQLPMMIQATEGSTSAYFAAVAKEEADFLASTNLEFIFHIQYLD